MNRFILAAALALSLSACATVDTTGDNGSSSSSSSSSSAAPEQFVSGDCQLSGCSAQICQNAGEEPMASDCMFRPVYQCYATARCEKQADGQCDWTMTSELSSCLLDPPEIDESLVSA